MRWRAALEWTRKLRDSVLSWTRRLLAQRSALTRTLAAWAALFTSLVLLRHELLATIELDYEQALGSGLLLGWYFDLLVSLYPAAAAAALWLLGAPRRVSWPLVAFLVWLAGMANLLHTRFFGSRLDLWVIELHWRDLTAVQGSAAQLAAGAALVASAGALLVALVLGGRGPALEVVTGGPLTRVWPRRLAWALAVLLVCVGAYRLPRWLRGRRTSDAVSDNIVRVWASQLTSVQVHGGAGAGWRAQLGAGLEGGDPRAPSRVLARYRDLREADAEPQGASAAPASIEATRSAAETALWPLERELAADPVATRALRERLGLPLEGPIHVMLLFLESVRAFEVHHPEIGPRLMPALREVLATHAIDFRQAYSSSFTAGQTVRGQFSTLCSMLPNITGAATYIAHSGLRVRCLQQLLRENGYETAWMNSHRAAYHGKRAFETRHGTHLFYDGEHYLSRGITEKVGTWGLADGPFLLETLRLFEELASRGPLFANVLTISVHHPYSEVPQGPLPPALDAATRAHPGYREYLSRLAYEDKALDGFFRALWQSPVAERTLVVLLADHSSPARPHLPLTPVQLEELRFRIPIALLTRDLPRPEVIQTPVHQIDVAQTVARIVGAEGPVTWVGRDLFAAEGSPWLYLEENRLAYRTASRACYPDGARGTRCYDVRDRDPLFDAELPEVPEPAALSDFLRSVVRANMQAIAFDLVQPMRAQKR